MARLLALDTTSEFGSIALLEDEEVAEEVALHSTVGFSHLVFPEIEAALSRAGWALGDIDCFAAASGPGSFTGVRVGLAAVKGLGEALTRPVAAVSNLEAIAWFGTAPLRAAVIDARRGQVYAAVYDAWLRPVSPEVVTPLAEWLERLPAGELEFLTTDRGLLRSIEGAAVREVPRALAPAVGRIALDRFRAGRAQDPAAIDANYVRRSDAEMLWRDRE